MRRFDVTDSLYFLVMMVSLLGGTSAAVGQDSNPCSTTDSCRRNKISYKVGAFMSGGKSIRVELFQPKAAGKYPVIILIHGSGGLLTRADAQMPREDNFGEMQIACGGYMAVLVHYFDRSGILSTVDKQYMEQESAAWLETLREAVDYASSLPKADPARIGLLGESLGGYLALSLAMRDKRIRVVSEYGGGVQLRDGENPETLPPVLIQHGAADSIVPVSEALRLAKMLTDNGVKHRVRIYEGLNHYPGCKDRTLTEELSIQFFDENLKGK